MHPTGTNLASLEAAAQLLARALEPDGQWRGQAALAFEAAARSVWWQLEVARLTLAAEALLVVS